MQGTVLTPEQHWVCPNCTHTDVTHEARVHTRFHACRGMKGLTAPMVPEGTRCKVEAHERDDYIGDELVRLNGNGRPVMKLVTTRDDGTDVVVFAPTAKGSAHE